ncbi:unnamed protein product [Cunninghamella blakesleeana]
MLSSTGTNKKTFKATKVLQKRISRSLKNYHITPDASNLIYLNYVIFMKRLVEASKLEAKKRKDNDISTITKKKKTYPNEKMINYEDIQHASVNVLREFRG